MLLIFRAQRRTNWSLFRWCIDSSRDMRIETCFHNVWSAAVTAIAYRPGEQMCHCQMSLHQCYVQIALRSSKRWYSAVSLHITQSYALWGDWVRQYNSCSLVYLTTLSRFQGLCNVQWKGDWMTKWSGSIYFCPKLLIDSWIT